MFSIQALSYSAVFAIVSNLEFVDAASTGLPHSGTPILKRQQITCPSNIVALCNPVCSSGQICILTTQTFDKCAEPKCVDRNTLKEGNRGNNDNGGGAGPIAGGVIGGLVVLGLIGFFIWRIMKKKREEREVAEEKEREFGMSRNARASTHTVASMSSTTTRASNVIQIGYLPGVMNRSAPSTPGHGQFIPPVPPLPANGEHGTPIIRYPQSPDAGTFFSADDILRASFCTAGDDPRASVATTIYQKNAIVSPVAANVVRLGKAAVVTVKGNSATSTPHIGSQTPPVPSVNYEQFDKTLDGVPPSPAFKWGAGFKGARSDGASTPSELSAGEKETLAVPRRAVPGRTVTAEAVAVESSAWEDDDSSDEDDEKAIHRRRTMGSSTAGDDDTDSPFSDRNSRASFSNIPLPAGTGLPPIMTAKRVGQPSNAKDTASLKSKSSNVETRSRDSDNSGSTERGKSPFDDVNAVDQKR